MKIVLPDPGGGQMEAAFEDGDAGCAVGEDGCNQRFRSAREIACRKLLDQADPGGLGAVDALPGEEQAGGLALPNQGDEAMHILLRVGNAEPGRGDREARVRTGEAEVAGHGESDARAEAGAFDQSEGCQRQVAKPIEAGAHIYAELGNFMQIGPHCRKFRNVSARAKGGARADKNEDTGTGACRLLGLVAEHGPGSGGDGVAGFGTVQDEAGGGAFDAQIEHARLMPPPCALVA